MNETTEAVVVVGPTQAAFDPQVELSQTEVARSWQQWLALAFWVFVLTALVWVPLRARTLAALDGEGSVQGALFIALLLALPVVAAWRRQQPEQRRTGALVLWVVGAGLIGLITFITAMTYDAEEVAATWGQMRGFLRGFVAVPLLALLAGELGRIGRRGYRARRGNACQGFVLKQQREWFAQEWAEFRELAAGPDRELWWATSADIQQDCTVLTVVRAEIQEGAVQLGEQECRVTVLGLAAPQVWVVLCAETGEVLRRCSEDRRQAWMLLQEQATQQREQVVEA